MPLGGYSSRCYLGVGSACEKECERTAGPTKRSSSLPLVARRATAMRFCSRLIADVMSRRLLLVALFTVSGCAGTPTSSVCLDQGTLARGFTLLDSPPPEAEQMRHAARAGRLVEPAKAPEYWFEAPDGRVLLCEPVRADGCDTTLSILLRAETGWVLDDGSPLGIICLKH